jgi:prepilin signal peptidase PulO-like enzyme (type II secretory pathway)
MREGKWKTRYLLFLVFVSFSTLCLIAMIAFLSPHVSDGFALRRQLTGLIFSALCILGIIAVFFPQHCARSPHTDRLIRKRSDFPLSGEAELQKLSWIGGVRVKHGHHPLCDPYRQHEFVLGKKTLCSACMGLFCGALISLAGAWYVFLQQFTYDLPYEIVFTLGAVLIVFGLAPYVVANPLGPVRRFSFNALMTVGMLLALVGVDGKAQSFALNAFLIGFFVFVLLTRINLSQDKHEQICATCGQTCAT